MTNEQTEKPKYGSSWDEWKMWWWLWVCHMLHHRFAVKNGDRNVWEYEFFMLPWTFYRCFLLCWRFNEELIHEQKAYLWCVCSYTCLSLCEVMWSVSAILSQDQPTEALLQQCMEDMHKLFREAQQLCCVWRASFSTTAGRIVGNQRVHLIL